MSIERVRKIFEISTTPRFTYLFGQGVNDVFVNHRLQELKFEEALFEELKRQGFDRIAFLSPHQSLFFLDVDSADLCRPSFSTNNGDSVSRMEMEAGPLPGLTFLEQPQHNPRKLKSRNGMGDNHSIRLIDTIIRQDRPNRTAVIFLQAETIFQYFEDQRTLASLVGDWNKIASTVKSRCFFVFSFITKSSLVEYAQQIQIPELRSNILQQDSLTFSISNIVRIGGPDFEEMRRILFLSKKRFGLNILETDLDKLCKLMSSEDLDARAWVERFEQVQEKVLNLNLARSAGWFNSTLDPLVSVWERLDQLTGLESVKIRVREIAAWLNIKSERGEIETQSIELPTLHMIFTGNPGTGKTTVARLFGEIFHELGILRKGHLVEARASDLVADYVGGTALKTNAIIDRALDGVLFLDEAYTLTESDRGGFGREAVDTLLARLENERHHLVVIAAGYPTKMAKFRLSNPGLSRRFPAENIINFPDFSPDELYEIFINGIQQKGLILKKGIEDRFFDLIKEMYRRKDDNFGNAGEIRNLIEGIDRRRASRIYTHDIDSNRDIQLDDIPQAYEHLLPVSISNGSQVFLDDLNSLVGLSQVKARLQEMAIRTEYEFTRYRLNQQLTSRPALQHLVFMGNPGTGKTTVARMVGKFYKALGLLSRGHCVEVTRGDLVAGYVGQTALRTTEKVMDSLDGVLFIDEAYSLVGIGDSDFGSESINTLIKMMEDFKDRFIVIAAGYPKEMEVFLNSNPGIRSRFSEPILFEDYSVAELVKIFSYYIEKEHYQLSNHVLDRVEEYFETIQNREGLSFNNARAVLQLIDDIKIRLAQRVLPLITGTDKEETRIILNTIELDDIPHPGYYLSQLQPNCGRNTWVSKEPKF